MEGVNATRYTIKVDTTNGRVDIATTSYSWGLVNVGLHVASNVVVDSLSAHNATVFYATGSINSLSIGASTITASNQILARGNFSIGTQSTGAFSGVNGVFGYYMKSMDGATQSSSCYVTFSMNDFSGTNNSTPGTLVFTSTNTVTNTSHGVLLESCAPGAYCRVATQGPVLTQATAPTVNTPSQGSTTRCFANNAAAPTFGTNGNWLTGGASNGSYWLMLGSN